MMVLSCLEYTSEVFAQDSNHSRCKFTNQRFGSTACRLVLATALTTLGFMLSAAAQDAHKSGDDKKDAPVAFKNVRIHTAAGPVIERGVLVIQKGKIIAVGAEDAVKIPAGAIV